MSMPFLLGFILPSQRRLGSFLSTEETDAQAQARRSSLHRCKVPPTYVVPKEIARVARATNTEHGSPGLAIASIDKVTGAVRVLNVDVDEDDISAPVVALRNYLNTFTSRASLPEQVVFPCTTEFTDEFVEYNARDRDDVYLEIPDCIIGRQLYHTWQTDGIHYLHGVPLALTHIELWSHNPVRAGKAQNIVWDLARHGRCREESFVPLRVACLPYQARDGRASWNIIPFPIAFMPTEETREEERRQNSSYSYLRQKRSEGSGYTPSMLGPPKNPPLQFSLLAWPRAEVTPKPPPKCMLVTPENSPRRNMESHNSAQYDGPPAKTAPYRDPWYRSADDGEQTSAPVDPPAPKWSLPPPLPPLAIPSKGRN